MTIRMLQWNGTLPQQAVTLDGAEKRADQSRIRSFRPRWPGRECALVQTIDGGLKILIGGIPKEVGQCACKRIFSHSASPVFLCPG